MDIIAEINEVYKLYKSVPQNNYEHIKRHNRLQALGGILQHNLESVLRTTRTTSFTQKFNLLNKQQKSEYLHLAGDAITYCIQNDQNTVEKIIFDLRQKIEEERDKLGYPTTIHELENQVLGDRITTRYALKRVILKIDENPNVTFKGKKYFGTVTDESDESIPCIITTTPGTPAESGQLAGRRIANATITGRYIRGINYATNLNFTHILEISMINNSPT